MDAPETIESNLVMPPNVRSVWWQYFGFPADDNGDQILSKKYVICYLCQRKIKYFKSTSNLRKHLSSCHPEMRMPQTKDSVELEIDDEYNKEILETRHLLNVVSATEKYSLSLYKWGNFDRQEFITIYVNSVAKGCCYPDLKCDIYDFFEIQSDTITNRLSGLDLSNCMAVVVNFSDNEEINNFFNEKSITIVRCLLSVIQAAIEDCMELPEVIDVVEASLFVLGKHKISPSDIRQDLWVTLWNTLNSFCDLTDKKLEFIADESFQEIHSSVKEIVEILRPIKTSVDTLTIENNLFAGLAKPFAIQLVVNCQKVSASNALSGKSATLIAEMIYSIIKRNLDEFVIENEFLEMAQFFDPRFLSKCKIENISTIRAALESKYQPTKVIKPTCVPGLGDFFFKSELKKEKTDTASEENAIEIELARYRSENPLAYDRSPHEWWYDHRIVYPHLKSIADYFTCVPFTIGRHRRRRMKINDEWTIHSAKERCLLYCAP